MTTMLLPIDTLGATVKAHIDRGDAAIEKAEQHYKAAGIHLIDARERLKQTGGMRWSAFLFSHVRLGSRRARELIALAEGRTTLAEMREQNRSRVASHRERQKDGAALRNADPAVPHQVEAIAAPVDIGDMQAIC